MWYSVSNLGLNITKMEEVILRLQETEVRPTLYINGECVERVHSIRFHGTQISADPSLSTNTKGNLKKAQQCLHFQRVISRNNVAQKLLVNFCAFIGSMLTYCISGWFPHCIETDWRRLQQVVNITQLITGCPLPSLMSIFTSKYLGRAANIPKDSSQTGSHLFEFLPSGR